MSPNELLPWLIGETTDVHISVYFTNLLHTFQFVPSASSACYSKLHQLNAFSICFADVRLRKLAEEKDELLAQIRKLKNQVEEERQKHSKMDSAYTDGERMENGTDLHIIEMQSKLNL